MPTYNVLLFGGYLPTFRKKLSVRLHDVTLHLYYTYYIQYILYYYYYYFTFVKDCTLTRSSRPALVYVFETHQSHKFTIPTCIIYELELESQNN